MSATKGWHLFFFRTFSSLFYQVDMKELEIKIPIQVFESLDELVPNDRELLELAKKNVEKSHAPYSQFHVGAAVRLADGQMFGGANHENAAYPMCLCAERTALATAHSIAPQIRVESIAITASTPTRTIDEPISPCGACRQVILEFEDRFDSDMRIIMQGEEGPIYILNSGKDLMPLSFGRTQL